MALSARSVGYTYGRGTAFATDALRGVDLDVGPGELVVIAGATGSGKSTLLRLLAGLLEPTEGAVSVDGVPAGDRAARGRVAIVFQNPETQFFAETVLADVAFGPRNLGLDDPEAAAADALVAVGLSPERFGPRSPFALSGGEARRVAIAGALAMRAPYLLLDEPTAGLDAAGRRDVIDAIEARRSGTGIVVVTHDPEEFLGRADRLVALRSGTVALDCHPARLLDAAERYEAAGLRLPEIVRAQLLSRRRGAAIIDAVYDAESVARVLLSSRAEVAQ